MRGHVGALIIRGDFFFLGGGFFSIVIPVLPRTLVRRLWSLGFCLAFGWRAEEWSVECKSVIIVANLG